MNLVTLAKRQSTTAGAAVILVGFVVLLSWAFGIGSIKTVFPSTTVMKANTAACFVLLGASLLILRDESRNRKLRYIGIACASLVILIATLTLIEYLTRWDLHIDQLLFADRSDLAAMFPPGRMAPGTAMNFLMLGVALTLLGARRAFGLTQELVLLALLYSLLTLAGYLYGASSLYNILPHVGIALHSTVTFIVLCFGVLSARPEQGFMAVLTSRSVAGVMLRRLLPAAVCLPILVGWVRLLGQRAGYYETEFGVALLALSNVIIFGTLTLLTAKLVHRLDSERTAVEIALREAQEGLEARVKERTAELQASNDRLSFEIAERARAEEALRKSDERIRQTQKLEAVGRLAGGIAHQFNNLMTIIIGYSELLQMRKLDSDPDFDKLGEIRKAGQRAAALTSQLLAFSRRQVQQPSMVDLNEVIVGVDEMLRGLLGQRMSLKTLLEPSLGKVIADRGQLEQILINLTLNARDAMEAGGLLTIETSNVNVDGEGATRGLHPGDYVVLSTTDNGTGMDAETQARIFEPFFTTKEQGQGTGLGLSVIDGIVRQSGGHVEVTSALNEGSTFYVFLPRFDERVDQGASAGGETE
ncbi:MAG TPA: ATP-binding protein [Blastocatellia bacterium]|nr:ATP-binding protein [Blastocatellia bacterium]